MPPTPSILRELRPTLALALPIVIGQAGQMLMGITDSVMIGRVGRVPLAASAFAHTLWVMVLIVAMGLLLAVSVLAAKAHGAGRPRDCSEYLRHGMAMAVVLGAGSFVFLLALVPFLDRFGQPAEVIEVMGPYFMIVAGSLLPALIFQVLRQYSEALGHPWVPMGILVACVFLNALLNWILIYGNLGAPALGLTGAGWATLIARIVSAAGLWWWLARKPDVRREWPAFAEASAGRPARTEASAGNPGWWAPYSWARFREMLAFGVPTAGQWFFEAGAFNFAALMMGWIGTVPLAAHQIAISCASFTFMFPMGVSSAVAIRIGRSVGEGRPEAARAIGFGALGAGVAIMAGSGLVFAFGGNLIAAGFTSDAEVVAMAAQLLVVAAIFQVFDGAQVVGAGTLRGLTDVKVPTVITFVAYWLVSLPLGYLLAFKTAMGPAGIWAGLAGGLACAAVLLGQRFNRLTRPAR